MPASTKHPKYDKIKFTWRSVRDAIEGTNAVKRAHEIYLPMPTGMWLESASPALSNQSYNQTGDTRDPYNFPWFHPNPAYRAYLQRARFPEIAAHTLRGLTGISTKTDPEFDLSANVSHLEEKATKDGLTLIEFYKTCVSEVLASGRLVITLDVDTSDNKPYLSIYKAESVINWNENKNESGRNQLRMVVFEEKGTKLDEDGFTHIEIVKQRVLKVAEDPDDKKSEIVTVQTFVEDKEDDVFIPSLQGNTLSEIPAVCVGSTDNDFDIDIIPLLGIAEIAYSIYRKDADLSNGEFLTCNPTLYMTGVQPDVPQPTRDGAAIQKPDGSADRAMIGSNVLLKISNPAAKVAYTQTDTGGFQHVANRILSLFTEAAEYGAAMLGPMKKGVESTESLKIRQADNGATLVGVSYQVSRGIERALHMCENWQLGKPLSDSGESEFVGATDFAELRLTSQDIQALVTAWMAKGISHETLLFNMKEAGFLAEGKTIEEEMGTIEIEAPDIVEDITVRGES